MHSDPVQVRTGLALVPPAQIKVTYTPDPREPGWALTPWAALTFEFLDEHGEPYTDAEPFGDEPEEGYTAIYVLR